MLSGRLPARFHHRFLLFLLAATPILSSPGPVEAQQDALVDRIAAVVGDSVITLTQIQERLFQLRSQGVEVPESGPALARLQRDVLDQIVGEQLIVQAAIGDSTIVVDDADLEEIVSQDLQDRMRQFGGQTAFQQALQAQGFSLASFREYLRGQVRQQRLYQQYMAKRSRELSGILVDDSEVEAVFQEQRENMGTRPSTVEFTQIIVPATPSDSAKEAARAEAERIRQLALEGDDFADLARRYSQEPGAQESGGDLGWFRRGEMVEAFEDAAFQLPAGEISPVVETPFGFHVIKVERRRSGEVRARHILIQATPTEADRQRAMQTADSVKARLETGADFQALRQEYGDPEAPDTLEVPFDRLRELPPGFAEPLLQSESGEFIGPIRYEASGTPRFAVVHVLAVRSGGEYTLDEVRPQIRERIQQQKLLEKILDELRSRTYVQIRI
jgi:peptidyl-prolyl cis-trans isomerase SurA